MDPDPGIHGSGSGYLCSDLDLAVLNLGTNGDSRKIGDRKKLDDCKSFRSDPDPIFWGRGSDSNPVFLVGRIRIRKLRIWILYCIIEVETLFD